MDVALDNRAKAYDRKGMHDGRCKDHAAAVAMRNPNTPTLSTAPTTGTPAGPAGALNGVLAGRNRVFVIAGGALVGLVLLALIAGAVFKPRPAVDSSASSADSSAAVVADSSASSATPAANVMSAADADRNGDAAWNAKNYDDALTFYRQAASQNDAAGQNGLGTLYYFGRGGLPQDYSQAMKWFQLSAAQGNPAQNSIGNIYENGYGVPVDYTQAMKWRTACSPP